MSWNDPKISWFLLRVPIPGFIPSFPTYRTSKFKDPPKHPDSPANTLFLFFAAAQAALVLNAFSMEAILVARLLAPQFACVTWSNHLVTWCVCFDYARSQKHPFCLVWLGTAMAFREPW